MANPDTETSPAVRGRKKRWRLVLKVGLVVLLAVVVLRFFGGAETVTGLRGTTFTVAHGMLKIDVTEGGSIEALESQEIKSEVQGQTKILSIVEEGYSVTPEDVTAGKILVELDATELLEKQIGDELEYQNSLASFTEAREAYEIQLNQNRSDITAAELEVKFALMDLEKYLGKVAAQDILKQIPEEEPLQQEMSMPNLEDVLKSVLGNGSESEDKPGKEPAPAEKKPETAKADAAADPAGDAAAEAPKTAPAGGEGDQRRAKDAERRGNRGERRGDGERPRGERGPRQPGGALEKNQEEISAMAASVLEEAASSASTANARYAEAVSQRTPRISINFTKYANIETLGDGEAGQKLRKLEDDLMMQQAELGLAKTSFEGTERLAERDFVTKNELETEKLKVQRTDVSVQSAEISRQLFLVYEFPKEAEKLLSDHQEANRKLERAKKMAVSKLAQAEARLKSNEARFALQSRRRRERLEQIQKCKIKAERPGLVVYANQENWRGQDQIQEGAMVRERQKIITIPDMNQMGAKIKIHESAIKSIQRDQTVTIRVDAYPDHILTGKVVKVAVLPDSENRWLNPDVKVYEVSVSIDGVFPWLKPGMSAQVDIHVKELPDVSYVPIQAVSSSNDQRVCYVARLGGPEKRAVETGEFNNEFIEIKSGLEEGEVVLLRAPVTPEEAGGEEKKEDEKAVAEKAPSAPVAAPPAAPAAVE
ncbi:MAG TPA: efflux RND transporter periplasmic adaptor subunit [Candidatus Bathyarchaeia archaeon]|nr:efflux RND transporter periplasmic adaptor subunit [Candidatus Bathyarchaeia archaeon]